MLSRSVGEAPDQPAEVSISFEKGRPVTLNGEKISGDALIAKLNTIAGLHGVGRIDIVENRLVGMKSRGCYETPGGTVVVEALRALEELVYDRETLHQREQIGLKFAELVYDGRWFTPVREALSAAVDNMAAKLTGEVVVRLHKGHATAIKRRSPNSLYSESFATFGQETVYDQSHAEGFIRLFSLPQRISALKQKGKAQ
jgi:argininosuccinate synthase